MITLRNSYLEDHMFTPWPAAAPALSDQAWAHS